jgi:hypothetical protein
MDARDGYPLAGGFPSERNLGCDAAAREKYIPAELKQQAVGVTHLDKLVEELTKRLAPVLSQEKEITGTGAAGNQAQDNRPELARLLSANNASLNSTATKLERIMRRLEI